MYLLDRLEVLKWAAGTCFRVLAGSAGAYGVEPWPSQQPARTTGECLHVHLYDVTI
jgi:hypothetical protein